MLSFERGYDRYRRESRQCLYSSREEDMPYLVVYAVIAMPQRTACVRFAAQRRHGPKALPRSVKAYLDRGLIPSQPLIHLLRDAVEELEGEVRVSLEVLPVLLLIPETLYDPRRNNCVLNRLLHLMLQVLGVLNVRPQH